jgi:dihydroflavonol-4-reductase
MKAAITGYSGHIGNCLVGELMSKGAEIKVLQYRSGQPSLQSGIEFIQGSLSDQESLMKLCEGVDVVFHLAAVITLTNRNRDAVFETNITGTKNLVDAAMRCGVRKFVHFSSIDAFEPGLPHQLLDEQRPLFSTQDSVYAYSKAESERVVKQAAASGLDAVILCPTAVIGPYDYRGSILGNALRKIFENRMPLMVSGGFNWVDVRDVAKAAILAAEYGRSGEKYILSGNFCSLKDLSLMISKIAQCRIPVFLPVSLVSLFSPFVMLAAAITQSEPVFTRHSLELLKSSPRNISREKAEREIGYHVRPLEQTLTDTYQWYCENKPKN